MKKRVVISSTVVGLILIGAIGSALDQPQSSTLNTTEPAQVVEKITPVCDGVSVTKNCAVDGVDYITYIYHPAVAEKSRNETVTTYEQKITSYCTLCNDGTYSPSCATGRGACSHHGGVAQWNAPRYSSVPVYNTKRIIDVPAKEAYYEKVPQ